MSKFHSTISRRNFMKGLGLAGAGLGAAAAAAPVFHDLDELTASKNAVRKLPWWTKEREFFDLTVEIDWPNKERYDKRNNVKVDSEESAKRIAECDRQYQQGVDISGNTRRDHALWMGCYTRMSYTLGGETKALYHASGTAEELGLPRWEATPEENLRTLAAAIHFYGGRDIGAQEITDKTKKAWYKCDSSGRPYTFADVDEPYSDSNNAAVIPNKCRWIVSWNTYQSGLSKYNAPEGFNVLNKAATHYGYSDASIQQARVQYFLRTLGYQGVSARCGGNNVGLGILAGLGEHGRTDYMINTSKGALIRVPGYMVTDLPLSPTKPIDAGIFKFCEVCKKCATTCPAGAIPLDDEPTYETTGLWNGYGLKSYHVDYGACLPYRGGPGSIVLGGCGICQGVCVFSKLSDASIHGLIQSIVATTPLFNTFFKAMDDTFGYGTFLEPDDFWNRDLESFPYKGAVTGL